MLRLDSSADLEQLRSSLSGNGADITVTLCAGTGCQACGCLPVVDALREELRRQGLAERVHVRVTGCHGFCEQGPLMIIEPGRTLYRQLKPDDVSEIVANTIANGKIIERLLYTDPVSGEKVRTDLEVPFYRFQQRVVLAMNPSIDPRSITEYIAAGGYDALAKVIGQLDPQQCVDEITRSGLRGRGGAGFPTGVKWNLCRKQAEAEKYLICNADEGDPGAYMDRSVLEGNPHLVIEGMAIGAYAIGAQQGYIYVRAEYPIAIEHTRAALQQAHELGLLGKNILGAGFDFDIEMRMGAGAFICGEESALIASLEGHRGMPRPRPPFPVQKGYLGKPTVINNVETLANIPLIIAKGSEAYAAVGTEGSKGTKIFALTGRVRNTGLVEVAMGTPLRTIVFDIGGGSSSDAPVKAVQTGGPSGGCLPVDKFDLPVDFDSLAQAGCMVGSGGMVVLDETTCMVDIARYFLEFTQSESCGKCPPCRIGTRHMLDILRRICGGKGEERDLELLQELSEEIKMGALCGLGQTAPNPVLTTIRYFRGEYESHIRDRYCPAHSCAGLFDYSILNDKCTGCGACRRKCPADAIVGERKKPHRVLPDKCVYCGNCIEVCPVSAVVKVRPAGGSDE